MKLKDIVINAYYVGSEGTDLVLRVEEKKYSVPYMGWLFLCRYYDKHGKVLMFKPLTTEELCKWVKRRVKKKK